MKKGWYFSPLYYSHGQIIEWWISLPETPVVPKVVLSCFPIFHGQLFPVVSQSNFLTRFDLRHSSNFICIFIFMIDTRGDLQLMPRNWISYTKIWPIRRNWQRWSRKELDNRLHQIIPMLINTFQKNGHCCIIFPIFFSHFFFYQKT